MSGFVSALDPASHVALVFHDTMELSNAIDQHHVQPIRPTGEPFTLQRFEGGWLLDGAPINVYIDGYWLQGQRELLMPFWQNKSIPTPSQDILAMGAQPLPQDVASYYFQQAAGNIQDIQTVAAAQAYQSPQLQQAAQQAIQSRTTQQYLIYGAIAVGAYLLFFRK